MVDYRLRVDYANAIAPRIAELKALTQRSGEQDAELAELLSNLEVAGFGWDDDDEATE